MARLCVYLDTPIVGGVGKLSPHVPKAPDLGGAKILKLYRVIIALWMTQCV